MEEQAQKLYTAPELAEFIKRQHAEITRQDILLAVKDQEIAQLKSALAAARSQMDPYQVACEIASISAPSNDDMRRLRAAEVAIAYCGRPKVSESRSVSDTRSYHLYSSENNWRVGYEAKQQAIEQKLKDSNMKVVK